MSPSLPDWHPTLAAGVRLRDDEARGQWVLLAPERLFALDEVALDVVKLIDGKRNLESIIKALAEQYDAPPSDIADDVIALLENLRDRRAIDL